MNRTRNPVGLAKHELDTPCLVLDQNLLEQNLRTMQDRVTRLGKKLRPHAKTHKCSHLARRQLETGSIGISVAKVSEAEVLVDQGITAVLITSPVVAPNKIERLMACRTKSHELMVVLDHPDNARALDAAAMTHGVELDILIDLDSGMGRTGVPLSQALNLAQVTHSLSGLRLRGVQCYAGHVQHIAPYDERRKISLAILGRAAAVVQQLRKAGLPCEIFTGTGTGTYDIDSTVPELTDIQAGSYTVMDAEYGAIGSAEDPGKFTTFRPAMTLLTTVISTHHPDWVTIDAGLKTLYHHGGTPYILRPANRDWRYDWFGDEHGKIIIPNSAERPKTGDLLELVVSHCDPTVNLFDNFYVTRSDRVVDVWPIDLRGKSQ